MSAVIRSRAHRVLAAFLATAYLHLAATSCSGSKGAVYSLRDDESPGIGGDPGPPDEVPPPPDVPADGDVEGSASLPTADGGAQPGGGTAPADQPPLPDAPGDPQPIPVSNPDHVQVGTVYPDARDPGIGTYVASPEDGAAYAAKEGFSPEDVAAIASGDKQVVAGAYFDPQSDSWVVDDGHIEETPRATADARAVVPAAAPDGSENPTLAYRQGPAPIAEESADAAVDQQGGKGESILPDPANRAPAGGGASGLPPHPAPPGLPGPGATPAGPGPAAAIAPVQRWLGALAVDLNAAAATTSDGGAALSSLYSQTVSAHNQALAGLDQKMRLPDAVHGAPAALPPPLPEPPSPPNYRFITPFDSPNGAKLQAAEDYRDYVAGSLASQPQPQQTQSKGMLAAADFSLAAADDSYSLGDTKTGDKLLRAALGCLDMAVSFVPVVGFAKDAFTVATGVNPITGDHLSDGERALLAGMLLAPAVLSGSLNLIGHAGVVLGRIADRSEAAAKVAADVESILSTGDSTLDDLIRVAGASGPFAERLAGFERLRGGVEAVAAKGVDGAVVFADKLNEQFLSAVQALNGGESLYGPMRNLKGTLAEAERVVEAAGDSETKILKIGEEFTIPTGGSGEVDLQLEREGKLVNVEVKAGLPIEVNGSRWTRFVGQVDRNAKFAKDNGATLLYDLDEPPCAAAEQAIKDGAAKYGVPLEIQVRDLGKI